MFDYFDEHDLDWPDRDDEPCADWDGEDVLDCPLNGDDWDVFVDDAGDCLVDLDEAELDIWRDAEDPD